MVKLPYKITHLFINVVKLPYKIKHLFINGEITI